MKHVRDVIECEILERQITAQEMAEHLEIHPAQLSRLRSGRLHDLSSDVLARILRLAGTSAERKIEILAAYLRDKLQPTITRNVAVKAGARAHEQARTSAPFPEEAPPLPPAVENALADLSKLARSNRRLQRLLISLATFARKE